MHPLSMFGHIDERVYVSDPVTYEVLYVNDAVKKASGDVTGRFCYQALQGRETPCPFCTNGRISGADGGSSHTWTYRNPADSRWYRCHGIAIPWSDGRRVRCEIAIDVTEQQKSEEELARFFDLTQDMLCILGFEGYARRLNPAFEKTLGFSRQELMDRPFMEFCHPDDRPRTAETLRKLAQGLSVSHFEQRTLCKDGSYLWMAWTAVPVVGEHAFYAVARDITEQRLLSEKLQQSEDFYRTITENAGSAIIAVEEDTTLIFVNDTFAEMSGYSPGELVGKMSWTDFFSAGDLARMKEYHRLRRVDPSMAPRTYEATFVDRERREIEIFATVAMIPGTRRSVGAFIDVSELKSTEKALKSAKKSLQQQNEELKKLDRLKDGVIRDVTHELKTPVAKLSMQMEILQTRLRDTGRCEELKKPFEVMNATIKRLGSTIRNLLELSRLEAGGRRYHREKVRLDGILSGAVQEFADAFEAMNIEVAQELEPVEITSDGGMLWHVFSNVLNNAVKFKKKDVPGKVAVSLTLREGQAEVVVRDDGIGMGAEEAEQAFERFYQASPSIEGCGVGLAISKMIVEELGGRIRIASEGADRGATVTIILPSACQPSTT